MQWFALSPVEFAYSPHVHVGDSKLPVGVSVYGCLSFHVSPAKNCTLPSPMAGIGSTPPQPRSGTKQQKMNE